MDFYELHQRTMHLLEHEQRNCDACASTLPAAYVEAIVHNEHVFCCSGHCIADLLAIWAPSRRTLPWREVVLSIGMVILTMLH